MLRTLTLAALAAAWPVAEAARVEVGFEQPVIQLTDLDASDGIAPSWTPWDAPYTRYFDQFEGNVVEETCSASFLACLAVSTTGPAYAAATFVGVDGSHLLSPMTQITATFSALASTVQLPGESVSGSVELSLGGIASLDGTSTASLLSSGTQTESGNLTLSFANNTNVPLEAYWMGTISFVADARNVAPVPEPETYALMLVGLAGVAWAVRRRRAAPQLATAAA